jgi:hypothetical protein
MSHLNRYKDILERESPLFMKELTKNPLEAVKKYPAVFTFSLLVATVVIIMGYLMFGSKRASTDKSENTDSMDKKPVEDDDDQDISSSTIVQNEDVDG